MATYDQIKEIIGIPKTTLADWKNADDYRSILFNAFRKMSVEELEGFILKSNKSVGEKMKYYRIEHRENNKKAIKTIRTKKPISQLKKEFEFVEELDNNTSKNLKELGVLEISYEE